MNIDKNSTIDQLISQILSELGEDPQREGLRETPERVARLFLDLTEGYREDPFSVVGDAIFKVEYDSMVVLKDIEYFSLCEHHLLPFYGKVHVGYIPDGSVIGAGKIPRIIELFSKRLQIQERMTEEIGSCLEQAIRPQGVGVVVEGYHLCMAMRAEGTRNAHMVTSTMKGLFRSDAKTRTEFLQFISPHLSL